MYDEDYLSIQLIDYVKSLILELEINYNYIMNTIEYVWYYTTTLDKQIGEVKINYQIK